MSEFRFTQAEFDEVYRSAQGKRLEAMQFFISLAFGTISPTEREVVDAYRAKLNSECDTVKEVSEVAGISPSTYWRRRKRTAIREDG